MIYIKKSPYIILDMCQDLEKTEWYFSVFTKRLDHVNVNFYIPNPNMPRKRVINFQIHKILGLKIVYLI